MKLGKNHLHVCGCGAYWTCRRPTCTGYDSAEPEWYKRKTSGICAVCKKAAPSPIVSPTDAP